MFRTREFPYYCKHYLKVIVSVLFFLKGILKHLSPDSIYIFICNYFTQSFYLFDYLFLIRSKHNLKRLFLPVQVIFHLPSIHM